MDNRPDPIVAQPPPGPAGHGREEFLNVLIGSLCETIENVVGMDDAEAFIGIVGRRMGQSQLARMPGARGKSPEDIAQHLADFKESIGGKFRVHSIDGSRITFVNSSCPFADQAKGRPSLCKMTTNVFGRVAADASGYARVNVRQALARGDDQCLVTVDLEWNEDGDGQEFYG